MWRHGIGHTKARKRSYKAWGTVRQGEGTAIWRQGTFILTEARERSHWLSAHFSSICLARAAASPSIIASVHAENEMTARWRRIKGPQKLSFLSRTGCHDRCMRRVHFLPTPAVGPFCVECLWSSHHPTLLRGARCLASKHCSAGKALMRIEQRTATRRGSRDLSDFPTVLLSIVPQPLDTSKTSERLIWGFCRPVSTSWASLGGDRNAVNGRLRGNGEEGGREVKKPLEEDRKCGWKRNVSLNVLCVQFSVSALFQTRTSPTVNFSDSFPLQLTSIKQLCQSYGGEFVPRGKQHESQSKTKLNS